MTNFLDTLCQWGWQGYGMGPSMMWGFGFGWIFMVVFWVLVILGVIFLVRYLAGTPKDSAQKETALDILKKRYARGEIDKEEFEQRKKDLL